jgi:steroid delta-isomerase-like uncharacterized protein
VQPEENKAVVRRFLEEIFTGGNLELVEELFAPHYVLHDPSVPGEVRGPEGIKQYVGMYRGAYPDTRFTVEDQIAEGDKVVSRLSSRATHTGELQGIPPTGKKATVTGIFIDRVADGKIVERWGQVDMLGVMQQLGVVPPPEQSGV